LHKTCDHNCFACKFEDCICPDDEMSVLELAESERRDRDAERYNCPADFDNPKDQARKRENDRKRRYRRKNPEKVREYHRQYKEARKDHYRELNKAYYAKNRAKIDAYRAEKRKRDKGLAAILQDETDGGGNSPSAAPARNSKAKGSDGTA
jgi:hypothetical protein